jgi:hypothetical protein
MILASTPIQRDLLFPTTEVIGMRNLRLLIGIAVVVAIAAFITFGGTSETAKAQDSPSVVFNFSVTFDGVHSVDEVSRLVVSNIGSSGEDGVSLRDFVVDSFFDLEYEIEYDKKGNPKSSTIDIEIVALDLKSSPAVVIDNVGAALAKSGKVREFRGHVTVLM